MDLYESRDSIEYRRALEKFYGNQLTSTDTQSIIKEWDEDDHPRDENGRFTSGGGSKNLPTDSKGNSYTYPTLKLSKKEYGKVMHSINDVYETRYKGETHGGITIAGKGGYTTYYFEIHEFNEYNIYRKEKS